MLLTGTACSEPSLPPAVERGAIEREAPSEMGTGEMGTGEMGTGEMGTGEMGTGETGSANPQRPEAEAGPELEASALPTQDEIESLEDGSVQVQLQISFDLRGMPHRGERDVDPGIIEARRTHLVQEARDAAGSPAPRFRMHQTSTVFDVVFVGTSSAAMAQCERVRQAVAPEREGLRGRRRFSFPRASECELAASESAPSAGTSVRLKIFHLAGLPHRHKRNDPDFSSAEVARSRLERRTLETAGSPAPSIQFRQGEDFLEVEFSGEREAAMRQCERVRENLAPENRRRSWPGLSACEATETE